MSPHVLKPRRAVAERSHASRVIQPPPPSATFPSQLHTFTDIFEATSLIPIAVFCSVLHSTLAFRPTGHLTATLEHRIVFFAAILVDNDRTATR